MVYSFTYTATTPDQLPADEQELCAQALEACEGSYAPYSNYHVGAAIRLSDGSVVTGANQENASYPCGTCAERTALHYAQSAHPTLAVEAIAVGVRVQEFKSSRVQEVQGFKSSRSSRVQEVREFKSSRVQETRGESREVPYPCGMCRQALVEAEQRQGSPIKVIVVTPEQATVFPSAACLLPFSF